MSDTVPTFAIVGGSEPRKILRGLDARRKRSGAHQFDAGETATCQKFWLRDLFAFDDMPGFRTPLRRCGAPPVATASEPLEVFRGFLARHRGQPDFEAECRLLAPMIEEDAGIIYVVDGSSPSSKSTWPRWKSFGSPANPGSPSSTGRRLRSPGGMEAPTRLALQCGAGIQRPLRELLRPGSELLEDSRGHRATLETPAHGGGRNFSRGWKNGSMTARTSSLICSTMRSLIARPPRDPSWPRGEGLSAKSSRCN